MDSDLDRRLSRLMREAQDGDRQAYEALLIEAAALLRGFMRKRLRRADHVEDVVQDTLLSIHHRRHTYDPARPFSPWMYGIARHRMLDFIAKQRRRSNNELLGETGWEELAGTHMLAERSDLAGFLQQALALLSHTQREIIQMLKVEGYSVAEIATKTGLSESSVKVTAHRGYKSLRKFLLGAAREG